MDSKKIIIVGAGNVGSRHLQALKAVNIPLEITVVDPLRASLNLSKERYGSMPSGKISQEIKYFSEIPKNIGQIDLGIIATCADVRADMIRKLLYTAEVRYLVLEKLLFTKKSDYHSIGKLLKDKKIKTWVNCPRRMMPFYNNLRSEFFGKTIFYNAAWSGSDLATNAVHFLDHMVFLIGSDNFIIDTDGLDKNINYKKRKGFLDFAGILRVLFKNGSVGNFVCLNDGNVPSFVELQSNQARYLVRETESKAWVSVARNNWQWNEVVALIPFQSRLTTKLAEEILTKGVCQLPMYEQSAKIHLQLLGPLRKFLNKNSKKKYREYPFT